MLSDSDITRIAAAVDHRASLELIKALTTAIGKAGCVGSSVERYGLVPALEAIVAELHRAQEQCRQFRDGTAFRDLHDECVALRSRSRELAVALGQATDLLEGRSVDLAQIEAWRKLIQGR